MNMNRPEKIIDALRVISARIKSFNPEHENPEEISSSIDELEKISRKEYSNFYVELKKIIDCRERLPDPEKRKLMLSLQSMIDKEENTLYKNEYKELLQKIIQ